MMEWKTTLLGEVLRQRKGSIKIDDRVIYKLCRVQVNRRGVVLREQLKGAAIRTKSQQVCRAGDFLVAEMDAKVGGYGFVPPELDGAIVSSHYYLFVVDEQKLYPAYLEVLSQAGILQKQIIPKGSTNYSSIRPSNVLGWKIPLPKDMEVQKRIASNFQSIQTKLAEIESEVIYQKELLARLKQAVFQEAIQGKLTTDWRKEHVSVENASELLSRILVESARLNRNSRLRSEKTFPKITREEKAFDIPKTWEWCRVGNLGNSSRGKTPKYSEKSDMVMLNQKCVRWGSIDLSFAKAIIPSQYESLDDSTCTEVGDLLVNSTGEGTIGRSAIVNTESAGLLYDTHILKFRPFASTLCNTSYLMTVINSEFGQRQINKVKGAQTTNQTELGSKNLNLLVVPVPPLAEQNEIVERVETFLTTLSSLEAEVELSHRHGEKLVETILNETFSTSGDSVGNSDKQESQTRKNAFVKQSPINSKGRAAFACYALNVLKGDKYLGRTKMVKIEHLAEFHCGLELGLQPIRDQHGPVDINSRLDSEKMAGNQNWYSTRSKDGGKVDYLPGPEMPRALKIAEEFMGEKKAKVDELLTLMKPLSTIQCEIVATLYASWNDFLLSGKNPLEEEIVDDVWNWHPDKRNTPKRDWKNWLGWLRKKNLIPQGIGKPVPPRKN